MLNYVFHAIQILMVHVHVLLTKSLLKYQVPLITSITTLNYAKHIITLYTPQNCQICESVCVICNTDLSKSEDALFLSQIAAHRNFANQSQLRIMMLHILYLSLPCRKASSCVLVTAGFVRHAMEY